MQIVGEIKDIQIPRMIPCTIAFGVRKLYHHVVIINITSLIIAVLLSGYSIFIFNKESAAKRTPMSRLLLTVANWKNV